MNCLPVACLLLIVCSSVRAGVLRSSESVNHHLHDANIHANVAKSKRSDVVSIEQIKKKGDEAIGKAADKGFEALDTNGDGKITTDDFTTSSSKDAEEQAQQFIDAYDTNEDGSVDKEEYTEVTTILAKGDRNATVALAQKSFFKSLDTDKDGKITSAEVTALLKKNGVDDESNAKVVKEIMTKLDTSKDGNIDQAELQEANSKTISKRAEDTSEDDPKEKLTKEANKAVKTNSDKIFSAIDKDSDGIATQEEMMDYVTSQGADNNVAKQQVKQFLATYDSDKDGKVGKQEFEDMQFKLAKGNSRKRAEDTSEDDPKEKLTKKTNKAVTKNSDKTFGAIDKDSDGLATQEELTTYLKSQGADSDVANQQARQFLVTYDGDGDGSVTKQEFQDEQSKLANGDSKEQLHVTAKQTFDVLDDNHDGKISSDEVIKGYKSEGLGDDDAKNNAEQFTKKFDTNKDGSVDSAEFEAGQSKIISSMQNNSFKADDAFAAYDTNDDGKITDDEIHKLLGGFGIDNDGKDMIKSGDANGDGVVDKEEFTKMFNKYSS